MELIKLVNSTLSLIDVFNEVTDSNLVKDRVQIKINVQSPGIIELFGYIDEIVIIALVITAILGGKVSLFKVISLETQGLAEKVRLFIEQYHKSKIEKGKLDIEKQRLELQKSIQSMEIKIPSELEIGSQEETVEKHKV